MAEIDTIRRIREDYPTPLGARHARFLNEVCLALGAQMFEKTGGDHTTLPNGRSVSLDVLIYRNQWVDVLGDAEGRAIPSWDPHPNPTGVFVDPLPMSAFEDAPPPDNPPPPADGPTEAFVRAIVLEEIQKAWTEERVRWAELLGEAVRQLEQRR